MRFRKMIYIIIPIIILEGAVITLNKSLEKFCFGHNKKNIYTNNSKISSDNDNFSYIYKKGTNENGKTNICFKFTGMDTIWSIISEDDAMISINFSSNIELGSFKVVLIDPHNNITKILEQSQEGTEVYKVKKGNNRIKIVAREAKGKLKLHITPERDELEIDIISTN